MLNVLKGLGVIFIGFFVIAMFAMYSNQNSQALQTLHSIPYGDKLAHFLALGLLTFFANILLDRRKIKIAATPILLGSVLVFAFASLDEVAQLFFTHRNCEFLDFVANYAGIYLFSKAGDQIPETIIPRRKVALIP